MKTLSDEPTLVVWFIPEADSSPASGIIRLNLHEPDRQARWDRCLL